MKLAAGLGAFLARLHRLGVEHGDPHPGNFVVRWQTNGDPLLHLIDLHLVQVGAPLRWPAARTNLLVFNRWFVQKTSRTDRQRFWRAYVAGRPDLPALQTEGRKLVRGLETDTWRSCLDFWRKRDARCLRDGKYFHVLRGPGWKAWGVRDMPRTLLERLGRDPEAPLRGAQRILKHSRSSTVAVVDLDLGQGMVTCAYKKFAWTKWRLPALHLVRATPVLRSWVNGHRMVECGLPTPRPLAVIERRTLGFVREGYLIAPLLRGAVDLHAWLEARSGEAHAHRCELLEKLARLVRRLHDCGLSHRDLKAANVLVTEEAGALALHFVDLVGVERHPQFTPRRRVRDLARLHASASRHPEITRTDKLRFLRVYLQWGLRGNRGWKTWWRAVVQATEHKLAKNRQRGRPIS
jgi:tRNA A-37 threonylcarbamoyl transferase component Bud32